MSQAGPEEPKSLAIILTSGDPPFIVNDQLKNAMDKRELTIEDVEDLTKEAFVELLQKDYGVTLIQANRAARAFKKEHKFGGYGGGQEEEKWEALEKVQKDLIEIKKERAKEKEEKDNLVALLQKRKEKMMHTSSYYMLRFNNISIVSDTKFNSNRNIDIPCDTIDAICGKMQKLDHTYLCENAMHPVCAKLLQEVLLLLNDKKGKELSAIAMWDKRYFATCGKMPDVVIGINDLYLVRPGPLGTQIVLEGCIGELTDVKRGQIAAYLVQILCETRCRYALGMLYSEKEVQFYAAVETDENEEDVVFESSKYEWSNGEWIKVFYHFAFNLYLKDELEEQMGFHCKKLVSDLMSPRGIIGIGGSSIVLAVNLWRENKENKHFSNDNSNDNSSNKNDNDKYQLVGKFALKIFHKKDDITLCESRILDKLFVNECEKYLEIQSMMQSENSGGHLKRKSDLIANMDFLDNSESESDLPFINVDILGNVEKKNVFGLLMEYLHTMSSVSDADYVRNLLKIAVAMKKMHSLNLFHLDFRLDNILIGKCNKVYIIDLQTMEKSILDGENMQSFAHLKKDLIDLLAIVDIVPNNGEINQWEKKYRNDKWDKIYQDHILPRFDKYVKRLGKKNQPKPPSFLK